MLELASEKKLYKVVVLNPKGGSGKTTLAFSLAGYLASTGREVGLLDIARQASSTWFFRMRLPLRSATGVWQEHHGGASSSGRCVPGDRLGKTMRKGERAWAHSTARSR